MKDKNIIHLGQVFTPQLVVNFMVDLLLKYSNNTNTVLEPSFGEGIFLDNLKNKYNKVYGVELYKELYESYVNSENVITYNNDFLIFSLNSNEKYDSIIANPPYVDNSKINKNTKQAIEMLNIDIDNKEWNLYYYFIYECINKLKDGGTMVFINPIGFLTNTYAKKLRKFIANNGNIKAIYSLEEEKIFDNASVETIIWVFTKENPNSKNIKLGMIRKGIKEQFNEDNFDISYINRFSDQDIFWNIHKVNGKHTYNELISNYFNISVGMVSGRDNVFKIDTNMYNKLSDKEKTFIIKIIKNKDLQKTNIDGDKYIFIEPGLYKLENDVKKELPNIYNYLQKYKENLLSRYGKKGLPYWEWATVRNKSIMENNYDKFCIPTITRNQKQGFVYVKGYDKYSGGDIITLTFKDTVDNNQRKTLKKIILSDEYTNYIQNTVVRKGNRRLFTQAFVKSLKIST